MRHIILPISFFFFSCHANSVKSDYIIADSIKQEPVSDTPVNTLIHDDVSSSKLIPCIWLVNFDKKTKTRNSKFKKKYLNADSLINGLNQTHPNIILCKIKVSGDTLFTTIKDSEYLGERIGSNGASAYVADVVINLTSIKAINFVKIDFEDGSHISHGTWSKKQYSGYKEVL